MAFNFGKGGGSFSQKLKTSQEISGLKSKIKAEQKKIESYYMNLGKVYYETCKDEAHPETQELVNLIRSSFTAIDDFNAQIAEIEAIRCCPVCGKRRYKRRPFEICGKNCRSVRRGKNHPFPGEKARRVRHPRTGFLPDLPADPC